jgi:hypothetical protein
MTTWSSPVVKGSTVEELWGLSRRVPGSGDVVSHAGGWQTQVKRQKSQPRRAPGLPRPSRFQLSPPGSERMRLNVQELAMARRERAITAAASKKSAPSNPTINPVPAATMSNIAPL